MFSFSLCMSQFGLFIELFKMKLFNNLFKLLFGNLSWCRLTGLFFSFSGLTDMEAV